MAETCDGCKRLAAAVKVAIMVSARDDACDHIPFLKAMTTIAEIARWGTTGDAE